MNRLLLVSVPVVMVAALAAGTGYAAPSSKGMVTSMVSLKPVGRSGVSGTATMSYNPKTKSTAIKIVVKHLKRGSRHPEHIHAGRCGSNGPVKIGLPTLKAGRNGIAVAKASFKGSFTHKKWYVNIHRGPGLVPASQFKVLACGNVM